MNALPLAVIIAGGILGLGAFVADLHVNWERVVQALRGVR